MTEQTNVNDDYPNWNVPGKELDQLIRRWIVKRQHDEVLEWYEDLRKTVGT